MVDPGTPGQDEKGPGDFDPTRVVFRTDSSGQPLALRPNEFLTSAPPDRNSFAFAEVLAEINGGRVPTDARIEPIGEPVGGVWQRYRTTIDIDVLRVVRGLRNRGVSAQPNHVYFTTTITAAPNMFAPNMFAPNMFAPNMFAPNMFAPNMFAGMGGGCCCSHGSVDSATVQVPKLAARPVPKPDHDVPQAPDEQVVEIHVIDIATPGGPDADDLVAGELDDPGHLVGAALDENADQWADPATGHGDFVQSVLELTSGLTATLWHAADPLGDIDDVALVRALDTVDRHVDDPDGKVRKILNLSLAGYNEDDRPSLVLADQVRRMVQAGWLIVAAAGNNGSCRLAWPAALPDVVSVGAYGPCGPAWFSNYGPWVDASAPGVDVVAEFPDLPALGLPDLHVAEIDDPAAPGGVHDLTTHEFCTGWASWSGTSFAAPFVAARLASELQAAPAATDCATAVRDALKKIVGDATLPRLPWFGTLVR